VYSQALLVQCLLVLHVQAREQLVSQTTTLEGLKAELKAAQDSKAALQVIPTSYTLKQMLDCACHAHVYCMLTGKA
jgi:hypothetical protein